MLAGSSSDAFDLVGTNATGNLIEGNLIGTDIAGTASIRNGGFGVFLESGATNNTIGGTASVAANVISSNNRGVGVDSASSGNLIEGNKIGTDITGTVSLYNLSGMLISGSSNTIGGTAAGAGNVISGNVGYGGGDLNTGWGVWITGSAATGNVVQGNLIGVDGTGEHILSNTTNAGIYINSATGNTIGGSASGAGNVISGNYRGIWITSANDNVVQGNKIGTDLAGSTAIPNQLMGIYVLNSASTTIGGAIAGAGNLISGNSGDGITIYGSSSTTSVVEGNLIGTDAAGTIAIANGGDGVDIVAGASSNTIGGTGNAGNLLSGNSNGAGVEIAGAGTAGNVVAGNQIGTNRAGNLPLANGAGVVVSAGASSNTVGGSSAGTRNVISGNRAAGVQLTGAGTDDNVVEGDYIGIDPSGVDRVGNAFTGVQINAGASDNTIGGTTAAAHDVIDLAGDYGVDVEDGATTSNVIEGNYIGLKPDGTPGGSNAVGILTSGATLTVIGGTTPAARNIISGNGAGVWLHGGDTTILEGNYIGTDPTGTFGEGNAYYGVLAYYGGGGTRALIGGLTATPGTGAGNVISGNGQNNIEIFQAALQGIEGNIIGLNASGTAAIGNAANGIYVWDTSGAFTIGGTATGAGNIIAGNMSAGIKLDGDSSENPGPVEHATIEGNYVGTDITGTVAIGNGASGDGILIADSDSNTIGGTAAGAGNVISGNASDGVEMSGAGTSDSVVAGNLIGTDYSGTQAVPNYAGVEIDSSATGNLIGTNGDGIGDALERNVLSGNLFAGVWITGAGTDQNVVAGNYIGTNVTATSALGNGSAPIFDAYGAGIGGGVVIQNGASNNLVGTSGQSLDDVGERNIISGSRGDGVDVYGSGTSGNVIAGNFIGTNSAGTAALSNAYDGVYLAESVSTRVGVNAFYGPENADQANVISANGEYGIELFDATASVVAGNLVGTDVSGQLAIPNPYGVVVGDSSNNLIGTSGQDGTGDAIERNVISGNVHAGIYIFTYASGTLPAPTTTGNVVAGNLIGTTASGTGPLGNGSNGVTVAGGANNWIGVNPEYGDENADQRNVISGNASDGVELTGASTAGNTVAGNYIGTNAAGSAAVRNNAGVEIDTGASGNLIGTNGDGTNDAIERNIISGNSLVGVWITGAGTNNNIIAGDYVGTNATGSTALPNGTSPAINGKVDLTGVGVAIEAGASFNRIGTNGSDADSAGERNILSGNNNDGLEIGGSGSSGNLVAGNFIGLAASGTAPIGNQEAGILLYNGATANTIGGITAALRNVIGGNANRGMYIYTLAGSSTPATQNVIVGNYIGTDASGMVPMTNHSNDAISIDLAPGNIIGGTVAGAGTFWPPRATAGFSSTATMRSDRMLPPPER